MSRYFCCDKHRLEALRGHSTLNGIVYLEVLDDPAMPEAQRQRTLFVHFVNPLMAAHIAALSEEGVLSPAHVRIEGGARIQGIEVTGLYQSSTTVLGVQVAAPGDFSTYTLQLVKGPHDADPPADFDPRLAAINFTFKAGCPNAFDCTPSRICSQELADAPEINYLAKDFASFRDLMLDRLALLVPNWTERNLADEGIALVELLAYVGDTLSYRQDAIATEAYLTTARRRTSARRHARLVDYDMHDGCNARAWVQVLVTANHVTVPAHTQLFTRLTGHEARIGPNTATYDEALTQSPECFETIYPVTLFIAHNEMAFYTWGDRSCCLPRGAIHATLKGSLPNLKAGDVVIFVQQCDPQTGLKNDADARHRHAARLTHVWISEDPLGGRFDTEAPDEQPRFVTEIQWDPADALPFPFCISRLLEEAEEGGYREDLSVLLGNVVLADHGRTLPAEALAAVPQVALQLAPAAAQDSCTQPVPAPIPPRYHPRLAYGPLTQAQPYRERRLFGLPATGSDLTALDAGTLPDRVRQELINRGLVFSGKTLSIQGTSEAWSASDGRQAVVISHEGEQLNLYALPEPVAALQAHRPEEARPALTLYSPNAQDVDRVAWTPVRHLLNSDATSREFVVEVESDGIAQVRFGDDHFGRRPEASDTFDAVYRTGNGARGNIGAGTLAHIVSSDTGIDQVWNPLPTFGGAEPEDINHVRQMAPYIFRNQERAVTPQDYTDLATQHPQVQRASATLRWTGSWYTVTLTVDRLGGLPVDAAFKELLFRYMERYRMAGHDLEIEEPHYVPLEIALRVCIHSDYFRADIAEVLLQVYSAHVQPDGTRGIFHPDNFTFGQHVYLSQIYAAAQNIAGIEAYEVTTFQRLGVPGRTALDEGKLTLGRLEIARLDNDPNFPEHGIFRLKLEGGR